VLFRSMARTYRQGQRNFTKHYFLTSGHNDIRILNLVMEKEQATTEVENELLSTYSENKIETKLDLFI